MVLAEAPVESRPLAGSRELPFISVIVPTYNRAAVLPYLFQALSRQVYPATQMELIVVDNSSSDDTEAVVASWKAALPFPVSFYRKDNRGPAASRNHGAARARGDILAFTDSDCLPEPGWLGAAAQAFRDGAGLVCGPVTPCQQDGAPGLLAAQLPAVTRDDGVYPTANLFVCRADFEAVGGFDESLGLYPWGELVAGEDADLAWRVRRRGAHPLFVSEAAVGHLATRIAPMQLLLRPMRVQVFPRLVRHIPELRQTFLWSRYFMGRARPLYYLALAGVLLAVATRQWPVLLAGVPWAAYHVRGTTISLVRQGRILKGLVWMAMVAWFETITTGALVLGSIRARRLVL